MRVVSGILFLLSLFILPVSQSVMANEEPADQTGSDANKTEQAPASGSASGSEEEEPECE